MDNVTHGLLGMAIAVAIAPRESRRQAALVGLLAGEFPDLDVFLRSQDDPLFGLQMHRHFTHSLLLAPVIGCMMAGLVMAWCSWRGSGYHKRILVIAGIAAAFSHGLCDVWTSYGTRWFWPFSEARVSWDLISVVDPLFTLPMLPLVIVAIVKRSRWWSTAALSWAICYLALCFAQQQRVLALAREMGRERGHVQARLTAKPSFANIVVWRVMYQDQGNAHILCIRAGKNLECLGESKVPLVVAKDVPGVAADSILAKDMARFSHFSDGWLSWHPQQAGVLGDLRYAVSPDGVSPLWGIGIDLTKQDQHVPLLTFRRTNDESWKKLWHMVKGLK